MAPTLRRLGHLGVRRARTGRLRERTVFCRTIFRWWAVLCAHVAQIRMLIADVDGQEALR